MKRTAFIFGLVSQSLATIAFAIGALAVAGSTPALAGDCVTGKAKFAQATSPQDIREAVAIAFDAKTADAMIAEHGDTLSELKDLAKQALDKCK